LIYNVCFVILLLTALMSDI